MSKNPFEEMYERDHPAVPDALRLQPRSDVSRAQPQARRLAHLGTAELGEQIVGSRHRFPVLGPINADLVSGPATVTATVTGAPAVITAEEARQTVEPHQPTRIDVAFAPTRPGEVWAALSVSGRWHDGHEESIVTPIRGSARQLTDVPASAPAVPTKSESSPDAQPATPSADDGLFNASFEAAGAKLGVQMEQVIGAQLQAVHDVQAEAARYRQQPAPRSAWWELAELALVIGTSGIAAMIGKRVSDQLMAQLGDAVPHGDLVADGLATAVEDGLKHPVESALAALGEGGGKDGDAASRSSADGDIEFFSRQSDGLRAARPYAVTFAHRVQRTLRPMLRHDSAGATRAVRLVDAVAEGAVAPAKQRQAAATAAQYATYRARAALGREPVQSRDGASQDVTRLERARHYERLTPPGRSLGLLDILVEKQGDVIRVKGARMNGVSQLVADRLLSMDLTAAHVPVRIVLGEELGFITRDEAGRVRVSGMTPLDADRGTGMDEPQQLRGAEHVAGVVLAKSLRDWGVGRVATDDASANKEGA